MLPASSHVGPSHRCSPGKKRGIFQDESWLVHTLMEEVMLTTLSEVLVREIFIGRGVCELLWICQRGVCSRQQQMLYGVRAIVLSGTSDSKECLHR